jgi:FtsP/CotA-like multicopper oxidase with cupredoxin domain
MDKFMANFNRRDLLKYSLITGGAALALQGEDGGSGDSGGGGGKTGGGSVVKGSTLTSSTGQTSPPMTPWVDELPIVQTLQPLEISEPGEVDNCYFDAAGNPCPFDVLETKNRDWWAKNKAASYPLVDGLAHQRYNEFPTQKWYQMDLKETPWYFHSTLKTMGKPALMFAYCGNDHVGTVPGPMIQAYYGEPINVRFNNLLPANHVGFGVPETATHLHNMHSPCESDGYPGDYVSPANYRDQHYPMIRAGYNNSPLTNGDYRESLGTLWYHDHRFNFTSQNVYKGMFGFFNAFDEYDCNDETGTKYPNTNLRMPSGKYDIMMGFNDPQFDSAGNIFFNVFDTDGHLGDRIAVNGKITPFLNVERRKYRFRFLDAGPSRWYQLWLSSGAPKAGVNSWQQMQLVANDGNLLENPVPVDSVTIGVANRMDVVVDFSNYNDGDTAYLVNRLEQVSGRGPTYNVMDPGVPVVKFIVHGTVPAYDPSMPWLKQARPASGVTMRPLPRPSATELATAVQRTFDFGRANGGWTVNGKLADISAPTISPKQGTCEIWSLKNSSGSWSHPVHIHFEEFQILDRNGVPPKPFEVSRKDVLQLGPNETVRCFFRFRDLQGHYVMHCHNVVHEDHAMMIRWDIVK